MKLIKSFALSCVVAVLFASGCKSKGSEFVGKWNPDGKGDSPLVIVRNGDNFLADFGGDAKMPAEFDKKGDALKIMSGAIVLTYEEKSDSLLMTGSLPGIPANSELKRVK